MINGTVFEEFAIVCAALEGTTKRNLKKLLIGTFLLKLKEEEISSALSFLIGRPFPESDSRNLGIGYGTILRALRTMRQSTMFKRRLTIMNVDTFFAKISSVKGKGARKKKIALIQILFAQARPLEESFNRILMGKMRIGVVEGVVLESISEAAGVPLELVQRANMFRGNIGDVARIALKGGIRGLEEISVRDQFKYKGRLERELSSPRR